MIVADTLITLLPSPQAGDRPTPWWLIDHGRIVARGVGDDRPEASRRIALLPATDCPVEWVALPGLAPRQAQAAARVAAARARIDGDALHIVASLPDGDAEVAVAVASAPAMQAWLDRASDAPMIPAGLLLDAAADAPQRLTLGNDTLLRIGTRVVGVDDPALADALLAGRAAHPVPETAVEARLVALVEAAPLLDMRSGRYAPPRAAWFDPDMIRRAALLLALIALTSLAIGLVRLARVHADIARIDAATAAAASRALGREVNEEAALAELDARLAATGRARGSVAASLAAVAQAIEPQPGVAIDAAAWDRAGTLTVTLGAARVEEINAALLALQTAGYRVSAQPRSGSDGRALGDITLRSEP